MRGIRSSVLAVTGFVAACSAQSACTGQQYNDLPGFPAKQSACYPTNYYRTSDLGQTSPADAQQRCQQQCTADSLCGSVVTQLNRAADNPNFYPSGTCFFYNKGHTVAPRRCADAAFWLQGYMKDDTNACFLMSKAAATAYCSSYLGIPVVTSTATATPAPVTTTTTVTTNPITSVTNTITATATATTIVVVPTTVTASTNTITSTATVTVTSTSTTTSASFSLHNKRDHIERHIKRASTVPAPACVTSGTPSTRLSAACSCLSVPTSTTTVTTTLAPITVTNTATSTITVTSSFSTTVTPVTVTATSVSVSTSTIATSVTVTTTSTSTATSLVTAYYTGTAQANCNSPQCINTFYKFNVGCGQRLVPSVDQPLGDTLTGVASFADCLARCTDTSYCFFLNYSFFTRTCQLYGSHSENNGPTPQPTYVTDPSSAYAVEIDSSYCAG